MDINLKPTILTDVFDISCTASPVHIYTFKKKHGSSTGSRGQLNTRTGSRKSQGVLEPQQTPSWPVCLHNSPKSWWKAQWQHTASSGWERSTWSGCGHLHPECTGACPRSGPTAWPARPVGERRKSGLWTPCFGAFSPKGAQRIMQKTLPASPRISFKIYPTALVKRNFAHCAKWHWVTFKNQIASEKTSHPASVYHFFTAYYMYQYWSIVAAAVLKFSTWQLVSETLPPKDRWALTMPPEAQRDPSGDTVTVSRGWEWPKWLVLSLQLVRFHT